MSDMGTARNCNSVCGLSVGPTNKKCKGRLKGAWPTQQVLVLQNLLPQCISEMGKARDFKFGVLIERRDFKPKDAKVG